MGCDRTEVATSASLAGFLESRRAARFRVTCLELGAGAIAATGFDPDGVRLPKFAEHRQISAQNDPELAHHIEAVSPR